MKRVLFLAILVVSIVEFTMERDRMYLVFTTAALVALIYSLFQQRHQIRAAPRLGGNPTQKNAGKMATQPPFGQLGS